MAINRKILDKLKEKTKDNIELKSLIVELLQKESEGLGWFNGFYKEKLEKYCKCGEISEN